MKPHIQLYLISLLSLSSILIPAAAPAAAGAAAVKIDDPQTVKVRSIKDILSDLGNIPGELAEDLKSEEEVALATRQTANKIKRRIDTILETAGSKALSPQEIETLNDEFGSYYHALQQAKNGNLYKNRIKSIKADFDKKRQALFAEYWRAKYEEAKAGGTK